MNIYLKWLFITILDYVLHLTLLVAPPIIALFTGAMPHYQAPYSWGWIWGTWDNPPQGDEGFMYKHAIFKGETTGFKGYVNRVQWMLRNKLYGYARWAAISYNPSSVLTYEGNPDISDKYGLPGSYFAKLHLDGKLIGFEYYLIKPYSKNRCIRLRLGWKMMTDKFQRYGFAQHVNTFNPFDGYDNND